MAAKKAVYPQKGQTRPIWSSSSPDLPGGEIKGIPPPKRAPTPKKTSPFACGSNNRAPKWKPGKWKHTNAHVLRWRSSRRGCGRREADDPSVREAVGGGLRCSPGCAGAGGASPAAQQERSFVCCRREWVKMSHHQELNHRCWSMFPLARQAIWGR